LGNGIGNATVILNIHLVNGSKITLNTTTSSDGTATFERTPTISVKNILADVIYKNKSKKNIPIENYDKQEITMDILLEIAGIPFSILETILIIGIPSIIISVGYYYYKKQLERKEMERILEERLVAGVGYEIPTPEEIFGKESLIDKIKHRISTIFEKAEEEEEEEGEWEPFG